MRALILSRFDPTYGPKIFLKALETLTEDDIKEIPLLMELRPKGFFIHTFEKIKSANLFFKIPSAHARGKIEGLLISIATNLKSELELRLAGELLKSFAIELIELEDAYKAFDIDAKNYKGDLKKLKEIENLFFSFFKSIKPAIKALEMAEHRYQALFQEAKDSIFIVDQKTEIIIDVNEQGMKNLNLLREEIVGKSLTQIMPDMEERDFKLFQREILKHIKEKNTPPIVIKYKNFEGKNIFMEANASQITMGEQYLIQCIFRDITERKNAEQKIKESEEKFRTISTSAHDAIIQIDHDGKICYWNKASEKIFGYSHDEVLGKNLHFLLAPKRYHEAHRSGFASFKTSGKGMVIGKTLEIQAERKDGTEFPIEISISGVKKNDKWNAIAVIRDISKRKQMEKKIKEDQKRLKTILNSFPVGVALLDKITHEIVDVNPKAVKMVGIPKEQIIGSICHDFICPTEKGKCPITDLGLKIDNSERVLLDANRNTVPILKTVVPLTLNNREHLLECFIDISERKSSEQKLKTSENNLRERVKELNCLYGISRLIEIPEITAKEIIRGTVDIIPYAWQFPDIACARIIYNEEEYRSDNFKETKWKLTISVIINERILEIEVYYLEEKPFLEEQIDLLDEIGYRLKIFIEQREAELKLKESEKKYRNILQNVNEGYFEVDLKGNYTFFNDFLFKAIEYSRDEMMGLNFGHLLDNENRKKVFKFFNEIYTKEVSTSDFQFEVMKKNGERMFVESSINLKYDSEGKKIGFFGLIRDISKRKKKELLQKRFQEGLEEEIKIKKKKLKEALEKQKLSLDQILKTSHFKSISSFGLRTPLNTIMGFTDLLLDGVYGIISEKQLKILQDIRSSAEDQLKIIKHIIEISD